MPLRAAHIPAVQIFRRHAIGRVALHIDALDPVAVDEIVDEGAAPGRRQGGVDVGGRHAQRIGLFLIDVDMKLLGVVQAGGPHRCQLGIARRQRQKLVAGLDQAGMAEIAAVFHFQIEAGGDAQFAHRRRHQGNTCASLMVRRNSNAARRAMAARHFYRPGACPIRSV